MAGRSDLGASANLTRRGSTPDSDLSDHGRAIPGRRGADRVEAVRQDPLVRSRGHRLTRATPTASWPPVEPGLVSGLPSGDTPALAPAVRRAARSPADDATAAAAKENRGTMHAHLDEIVRERARRAPASVALGGQDGLVWRSLTSADLLALVDATAERLRAEHGVDVGDRVVLWLPGGWRTPVYLFALWRLGAIAVPFDREVNPEAGRRILTTVEPRLIVTGYGETPAWAADDARRVEWWEPTASPAAPAPPHLATALADAGRPPTEAVAAIVFTSGTTGTPKGCTITHANLCAQIAAFPTALPIDADCRLASILPLSHLLELTCGLLYPLDRGASIHYIPTRREADLVRVFKEQRITHMVAVPQLYTMLANGAEARLRGALPARVYRGLVALADRSPMALRRLLFRRVHAALGGHLRLVASGGAALPIETQRFWQRLGVRMVQGYGTSECSPVVSLTRPDGSSPEGSVGQPIPGVTVRLRTDPAFEPGTGELVVRGPNVMLGYWRDPERTAEVLVDGWYATGDLARIDAAGNIFLVGRARELIVLPSGMNVWPSDVEDALRADPAVRDAAIVRVDTPTGGATLHAYLIPARSGAGNPEIGPIVARANARLALHQRVATASWWVSDSGDFPRTSTLKVQRHRLPPPSAELAVAIAARPAGDDPVGQAIAAAAGRPAVGAEQTLGQLGLDSLALVELAVAIEERTGVTIADGVLHPELTVQGARDAVDRLGSSAAPTDRAGGAAARELQASIPAWLYGPGRVLRALAAPFDWLYAALVTETIVLDGALLAPLAERSDRAVVFAGTHRSWGDMSLLRHALGRTPARRFVGRMVVAASAWGVRDAGLLGWYAIAAFGLYPLRQYAQQTESLRGLVRAASQGNAVLIFPQGTHVAPAAERGPDPVHFKPGVARIVEALAAEVVPFGLAGSEAILPPSVEGWRGPVVAGIPIALRRRPLAVAFGAPLRREPGESAAAFTERLEGICYALARRAQAEVDRRGGRRAR